MKRPGHLSLPSLVLALALLALTVGAAHAGTVSTESYHKARAVLDAAVEAAGGAAKLNAIKTVYVEREGTGWARNQSPRVTGAYQALPQSQRFAVDLEKGWLMLENRGKFPGGFVFANRTVFKEDDKFTVNLITRTVQENDQLQIANFEFVHRLCPPLMLRKAFERAGTVRWLGESKIDGRKHDAISFAWDNGALYTLYIDAKSHQLTKYELIFPDALTGDAVSELYFPDYREVDGFRMPNGFWQRLAGDKITELHDVKVAFNQPLDAELFAAPEGFAAIPAPPTDLPKLTRLSDAVGLVEGLGGGGYNVLFVEFSDHVVVMEAPLNSGVTSQALAMIEEAVPEKPVRYAVLSHHHDDHTGGMRELVARGIKIVTVAENREYFEKMARGTYTLAADAQAREPKKPDFELLDGKRVFAEGDLRLEILDIGPNPHAESLLIAYLPAQKILFEADLLGVPRVGPITPAIEATVDFADKLDDLGLEVETLVGVHGTVGTRADLDKALALREKSGDDVRPAS